jgi:type II restriction enzyme
MTQSQSLSNNKNQHTQKNKSSKVQEKIMITSVNSTLEFLKEKYPKVVFGFQKKLDINEIYLILRNDYGVGDDSMYLEPVKDGTFITPDGGFIYAIIDGFKRYILVAEHKTQGTNDRRLSEGKARQALGNAIERLFKNYNALDMLFSQESILPFVSFLQGCDFHESETIGSRVITGFKGLRKNSINLFKDLFNRAGTYYMRGHKWNEEARGSSDWTYEEMLDVFKSTSEQSLEYYINKYSNK